MRYVVDASTAIRWYVESLSHPHADEILKSIIVSPGMFAIPELFTYEVLSVLYKVHEDAASIYKNDVNMLLRSGILRYPMTDHIFSRADRFIRMGLTGYDACYVALAEELQGTWLTFDFKAWRVLDRHGVFSAGDTYPILAIDLNQTPPFGIKS